MEKLTRDVMSLNPMVADNARNLQDADDEAIERDHAEDLVRLETYAETA